MKQDEPRERGDLLGANLEDFLHLQRTWLLRVAEYVQKAGEQASTGAVDPGEWINVTANFVSAVIGDVGEWLLGRPADLRPNEWRVTLVEDRVKVTDRTKSIAITVPPEAFLDADGKEHASLTLVTGGLQHGAFALPIERSLVYPPTVSRLKPHARLKLSDLKGRLVAGRIYRGAIWARETKKPVAAVALTVEVDQPSDDKRVAASRRSRVAKPSVNHR
jgi:hypothetical protein